MHRPSLLLVIALTACSKTPEAAPLADFATGLGQMLEPACVVANDGKRFIVEGYLLPDGDVRSSDGYAGLQLYGALKDGEGEGPRASIKVKEGSLVSFDLTDHKTKFTGDEATIRGITLHTTTGDVKPEDRVAVVFDMTVIQQFQTKEVTACELTAVELRKL